MAEITTAPTEGNRFISLRAAGRRVGLSYWTMHRRVRDGVLPGYRTGPNGALRVKVGDVDALLVPVAPHRD